MVQILGKDSNRSNLQGDDFHQALVDRWMEIRKKGLSQGVRKNLLRIHPHPKQLLFVKL